MPLALAIPALISAGTSIIGGVMQHKAAGKAANAQVAATQGATQLVNDATGQVNPYLQQTSDAAGQAVINSANTAGQGVLDATGRAAAGVNAAVGQANNYLNPYMGAGSKAVTNLENLANGPGFTFSEDDPSYQWRLQEGQKALERGAAARGALQSGGFAQALTRYAQKSASTEYQAAFDRFQNQRKTSAGMFTDLASLGLKASGQASDNTIGAAKYVGDIDVKGHAYAGDANLGAQQFASGINFDSARAQGQNTMNTAHYAGDALMGQGDARAAESIAKGNAWAGTLGGVGNAASSYFTAKALQPKTVTGKGNTNDYSGFYNWMGAGAKNA
jgi:hypothetical protein